MEQQIVKIYQLSVENEVHRASLESFIPGDLLNRKNLLVFGAVHKDYGLIGVLLSSVSENVIEIEYLVVDEEFQRQGVGRMLMNELLSLLDLAVTPYIVTMFIPKDPEHEKMIEFCRSLGVFAMTEYNNRYYVKADFITSSEKIQQCVKRNYSVRAVSLAQYSKQRMAQVHLIDFVNSQQKRDIADSDELVMKNFGDLSAENSFICETDSHITAVLLTHRADENVLDISHVFMESDDGNYIGAMLKGLYDSIAGRGIDIMFTTASKSRRTIADQFFERPYESTVQCVWSGLLPEEYEVMSQEGRE